MITTVFCLILIPCQFGVIVLKAIDITVNPHLPVDLKLLCKKSGKTRADDCFSLLMSFRKFQLVGF